MRNTSLTPWIALLATTTGFSLAGCRGESTPSPQGSDTSTAKAQRWRCGDTLLETRLEGERLRLRLPGGDHLLEPERSASGARYGNAADMQFWSKGDDNALFRAGHGRAERECAPTDQRSPWIAAAEGPVDLRAAGNEPGWTLEAHDDGSVQLALGYGERSIGFDARSRLDHGAAGFEAINDEHRLHVAIDTRGGCIDSMSGTRFPLTVSVALDDEKPLSGCGRRYGDRSD